MKKFLISLVVIFAICVGISFAQYGDDGCNRRPAVYPAPKCIPYAPRTPDGITVRNSGEVRIWIPPYLREARRGR